MTNSIVALIPSRANSKRIPGKALKDLGGRPLIDWTIIAAKQSGIFDTIYVCSDDEKALARGEALGVQAFRRNLAHDTQPDIQWVSQWLWACGKDVDAFSILRPTSPFRMGDTIRRAWAGLQSVSYPFPPDSLRAVETARQHPAKMWRFSAPDYLLTPLLLQPSGTPWHSSPTQTLPKVYAQTAGLEIAWTDTVRRTGTIAGDRILAFEMHWPESLDLNTPEDWLMAEVLLERGLAKLPEVT